MSNTSFQLTSQQITPEQREQARARAMAEVQERQSTFLPTLKLKNVGGDAIEGVKDGEYFVTFQEEDDDGNKKKRVISVGANPAITIIKRLYTYSWYREAKGETPARLMAWTNELEAFTDIKPNGERQEVVLVDNSQISGSGVDEPKIVYDGNYKGFKEYKDQNYRDRDGDNLLKFRNVLYVYLPVDGTDKCVFRFYVSNASVTGVKDGAKSGDYKNPEDGSLLKFIESVQASEHGILYGTKAKLGSRYKSGGIPYYLATFENAGPVANVDQMTDLYIQLETYLIAKFENDFGNLEEGKQGIIQAEAIDVAPGEATNFDTLPDRKPEQ
jgi:hypothetical protein